MAHSIMKLFVTLCICILHQALSFVHPSQKNVVPKDIYDTSLYGYIPNGMTPEEWKKLKQQEQASQAKKKYGAYGPQSFKSRSMQAFQQDLEKGKASHLLPIFNAKEQIKSGLIKPEDIPYMQRGGSWDNSDVGKSKKKWTDADRKYRANEAPATPDWLGNVQRKGPQQQAKISKLETAKPPKKFWGLF